MFFFFLALIHALPLAISDLFCHLLSAPAPVFTLPSALAPALTPTPAPVVAFALNGLCLSITENKHIKAVKEPWRQSSHYKVLGQILLTNQQLDKLSAAQVDFTRRGMLTGTCLSAAMNALVPALQVNELDEDVVVVAAATVATAAAAVPAQAQAHPQPTLAPPEPAPPAPPLVSIDEGKKRAQTVPALADKLDIPCLPNLLGWFLFQQLHPNDPRDLSDIPLAKCPHYLGKISVLNSASSRFYALHPLDPLSQDGTYLDLRKLSTHVLPMSILPHWCIISSHFASLIIGSSFTKCIPMHEAA
ncbi:hypothetical protein EDB19DRAFT_1825954 [Suillus lakei]|nr:hypothetical protein EDB19DRAFT_1825954 [Suillus lakei]